MEEKYTKTIYPIPQQVGSVLPFKVIGYPLSATVEEGANFLAILYDEGIGYSALNTTRSALSTVFTLQNNHTFGTHPLVTRFMKGVFETRPSLPCFSETWDVNVVLDYKAACMVSVSQGIRISKC